MWQAVCSAEGFLLWTGWLQEGVACELRGRGAGHLIPVTPGLNLEVLNWQQLTCLCLLPCV